MHETTTTYEPASATPWRASCSCGWHGVSSWTEAMALAAGAAHVRDATAEAERETEAELEARLGREAQQTYLGELGDRAGVNVAKVEVTWTYDDGTMHAGYYLAHASGDEEGAETIYDTFAELVDAAMTERVERLGLAGWETTDTYAA